MSDLLSLPQAGKYRVIYADPPWPFATWSHKGQGRSGEAHYVTMSHADIEALPVDKVAAPDAVLFLWIVQTQMPEALALVKAWGFTLKSIAFAWVKIKGKQDRLFYYDKHLYVYGQYNIPEADSLLAIMSWCLEDDLSRERTIRNTGLVAHEWAYRYHTYKARMRELLFRTIGYGSMDGLLDYDRDAGQPSTADAPQAEVEA